MVYPIATIYISEEHVTVLSIVGNCNTIVNIIILYYNLMGPLSYMQLVTEQNITRHVTI